jgi:hypothetical protein
MSMIDNGSFRDNDVFILCTRSQSHAVWRLDFDGMIACCVLVAG